MALLYFDGYDQYAKITAPPSAAAPVTFADGLDNLTTVSTDPSIYTSTSSARFCRIFGEDRVWRTINGGNTNPSYHSIGTFTYAQATTGTAGTYSSVAAGPRYGLQLDSQAPLTTNKKLVFGFKNKLSPYASYAPSANDPHLLAAFSTSPNFTDQTTCFGLTLESGNVYISGLGPITYGYLINRSYVVAGNVPVVVGGSALLGPTNFVVGACNLSSHVPTLDQLASNTVEVEVTVEGKVTCWINNQYVGSVQFVDPARVANIRYVKTGMIQQRYSSNYSSYGFNGITDVYLLNGLGTRNINRLGKVKVVSRLPTTDAAVQFTRPDTSNSNADVAGQVPPLFNPSLIGVKEGDTDLYGSTAFNFTNEAIIATSVTTTGYKTDPTGNDIAPVLSVSGTPYVGNTNVVPISASLMKSEQHIYELNPKTGLPFVKTDLDATTFGVTVVAPASGS